MPFPSIAIVIAKLFCLLVFYFNCLLEECSALPRNKVNCYTNIRLTQHLLSFTEGEGEKAQKTPRVDKLFRTSPLRLWNRQPCVRTLVGCAARTRAKPASCPSFQEASLGGALGKDSNPNNCALVNVMSQAREQGVKMMLGSSEQSKRKDKTKYRSCLQAGPAPGLRLQ